MFPFHFLKIELKGVSVYCICYTELCGNQLSKIGWNIHSSLLIDLPAFQFQRKYMNIHTCNA